MSLPIAITLAYLAINLAMLLWIEREQAAGRVPASRFVALSRAFRYGPPLAGAGYLVALTGDWLFVLFVIGFFAGSFWMMNGLLAFTDPNIGVDSMRSGWDDRQVARRGKTDRDSS